MSDRWLSSQADTDSRTLRGSEGELIAIRIHIEARALEDLLEALALASFPVNPEIRHATPDTIVEFPAYEGQMEEIRKLIAAEIRAGARLEAGSMLAAIQ
jgi:hypothetical protein